jgi:hypothetical protein
LDSIRRITTKIVIGVHYSINQLNQKDKDIVMNLKYWLSHPQQIGARISYWVWEKRNPDKPWLCPGTIHFCEQYFNRSAHGVEFGSGRSTRWFSKLTSNLTSIEHSKQWYNQVQQKLKEDGINNVDYRFIPLEHPQSEPEKQVYEPLPSYVAVLNEFDDKSLDFVIVDGHYRTNCIQQSISKIRSGGYLLVDDIGLWPSLESMPIPSSWKVVDDSNNGVKRCVIWQAS